MLAVLVARMAFEPFRHPGGKLRIGRIAEALVDAHRRADGIGDELVELDVHDLIARNGLQGGAARRLAALRHVEREVRHLAQVDVVGRHAPRDRGQATQRGDDLFGIAVRVDDARIRVDVEQMPHPGQVVGTLEHPVPARIEPLQGLQLTLVHPVGIGVRRLVEPAPVAGDVGEIEPRRHEEMIAEEVVAFLRVVHVDGVDLVELRPDPLEQREPALGLAEAPVAPAFVLAELVGNGRVGLPERQKARALVQRQEALQQRRAGTREAQDEQRPLDPLLKDLRMLRDQLLKAQPVERALHELALQHECPEQRGLGVLVEGVRTRRQGSQQLRRPVVALQLALHLPHHPLRLDTGPQAQRVDERPERIQQADGPGRSQPNSG